MISSSARGNTSLESAVTLTKSLRWEIQSLGVRLAKVANAEELFRRGGSKSRTRAQSELEVKLIIQAIRKVLERIEDAVPLINLAITTSGANLSTNLPATVSPSRLLQASTFLTTGDTQYSFQPGESVQIGPTFTLSMYMLFSGHSHRQQNPHEAIRQTIWKEVIHKAHVKIRRTPLEQAYGVPHDSNAQLHSAEVPSGLNGRPEYAASPNTSSEVPFIAGEHKADEFAYQIFIIEDFDDDRVHSFEDDEPKPSLCEEVEQAGIRVSIPIHQISKIFYADTGKILNIGSEGEINNPVLLLKRDVNAMPPRRMVERFQLKSEWPGESFFTCQAEPHPIVVDEAGSEIAAQFSREIGATDESSSVEQSQPLPDPWRLPLDLDQEWIAFEVYTEHAESDYGDDDDGTIVSGQYEQKAETRPSFGSSREPSLDPQLTSALSALHLNNSSGSVPPASPAVIPTTTSQQLVRHPPTSVARSTTTSVFNSGHGPVRTSLSLLEMLIRLTALQQFQQVSHLSIPDELLNFFLSESSTTGAGGDSEERRRKRWEARRKVGFDPYDESPAKYRGEDGIAERRRYRQSSTYHDDDEEDEGDRDREREYPSSAWPEGGNEHHDGSTPWSNPPRSSSTTSSMAYQNFYRRSSESPSPSLLRTRKGSERGTPIHRQSSPLRQTLLDHRASMSPPDPTSSHQK